MTQFIDDAPTHPATQVRASTLARTLDVVDYGMLIVGRDQAVLFANQVAQRELRSDHPMRLCGQAVRAERAVDAAKLAKRLAGALDFGRQSLITLVGGDGQRVCVSIVPLPDSGGGPSALLVFGRRRLCEDLSTDAFAREHALTLAETRVLKLLCAGRPPCDIARTLGVKLSTVRTQIGCIRAKTDSRDIGGIVQTLSRLPPLPSLLRQAA